LGFLFALFVPLKVGKSKSYQHSHQTAPNPFPALLCFLFLSLFSFCPIPQGFRRILRAVLWCFSVGVLVVLLFGVFLCGFGLWFQVGFGGFFWLLISHFLVAVRSKGLFYSLF
jgi:hypothetical protein